MSNLAHALVAHPRFTYEQGMAVRILRGGRWLGGVVTDAGGDGGVWVSMGSGYVWINLVTNAAGIRLDDLSDPATSGALVAMLGPHYSVDFLPGLVQVYDRRTLDLDGLAAALWDGPDLGHAVAAALLASWGA